MEDIILTLLVGAAYGIVYAGYGIVTKKPKDEEIDPKKLARTVTVFVAAGVLAASQGRGLSFETVDMLTAEVAVVGILFDMGVSKVQSEIAE